VIAAASFSEKDKAKSTVRRRAHHLFEETYIKTKIAYHTSRQQKGYRFYLITCLTLPQGF